MNTKLKEKLIDIAKQKISSDDPSHDFLHALRVATVAEQISKQEKADLDIVVPAALFHDLVNYLCKDRKPDDIKFALDLFFTRLLKVKDRMHTATAKKMAKRRTLFLKEFLRELELELKEQIAAKKPH